MNCKHPTLYVLGPENKPAPYGYCMLCEVARLTADIATLERRERSRNNRIAELEDALPALDARKAGNVFWAVRNTHDGRYSYLEDTDEGWRWISKAAEANRYPTQDAAKARIQRFIDGGSPYAYDAVRVTTWDKASPASRDGRQGELAQAIAERNELRKDAARYWFLRSVPEPKVREVVGWLQWLSKEAFDAAIDEAIATAQKEQTYAPAATAEQGVDNNGH